MQLNIFGLQSLETLTHLSLDKKSRHFAEMCIFVIEKAFIFIKMSLPAPNGPFDNDPALVQMMVWCRIGDKPLFEPMPTRITDAYMRH